LLDPQRPVSARCFTGTRFAAPHAAHFERALPEWSERDILSVTLLYSETEY